MLTYSILPEHSLKVLTYTGQTSLDEWFQVIERMRAEPEYSPDDDVLIDVTGIERHFTRRDLESMVAAGLPPVRYAIVAPTDVSYGIARMFEMLSESSAQHVVAVFRNWDSALRWLDRDSEAVKKRLFA